jgi:hypothetical protein
MAVDIWYPSSKDAIVRVHIKSLSVFGTSNTVKWRRCRGSRNVARDIILPRATTRALCVIAARAPRTAGQQLMSVWFLRTLHGFVCAPWRYGGGRVRKYAATAQSAMLIVSLSFV